MACTVGYLVGIFTCTSRKESSLTHTYHIHTYTHHIHTYILSFRSEIKKGRTVIWGPYFLVLRREDQTFGILTCVHESLFRSFTKYTLLWLNSKILIHWIFDIVWASVGLKISQVIKALKSFSFTPFSAPAKEYQSPRAKLGRERPGHEDLGLPCSCPELRACLMSSGSLLREMSCGSCKGGFLGLWNLSGNAYSLRSTQKENWGSQLVRNIVEILRRWLGYGKLIRRDLIPGCCWPGRVIRTEYSRHIGKHHRLEQGPGSV